MNWLTTLFEYVQDLSDWIRRQRNESERELSDLDPELQRRIILQAALESNQEKFKEFRKSTPTLAELDHEMRDHLIGAVVLCFTVILPIILLVESFSFFQVRKLAKRRLRHYLAHPDPLCELVVLEGSIRRVVKTLPRQHRKDGKIALRELRALVGHWESSRRRLEAVQSALPSEETHRLREQIERLEIQMELESDPLTMASLERRASDLQARLRDVGQLHRSENRLRASQNEILETLRTLRTQLALLAAGAPLARNSSAAPDAVERLQELNLRLKANQDATEEVLQLGRH